MDDSSDDGAVSAALGDLLQGAVRHAGEQLSLFVERDVSLHGTAVSRAPVERLPDLMRDAGRLVTAVYLAFEGDLEGHIVFSFAPEAAAAIAALLLGEPVVDLTALTPLEGSALGEVGNVTAASVLNAIATARGLTVYPSPPVVMQDMIGALLDAIVADMALDAVDALLLHTTLTVEGQAVQGDLLLLPNAASRGRLEQGDGARQAVGV